MKFLEKLFGKKRSIPSAFSKKIIKLNRIEAKHTQMGERYDLKGIYNTLNEMYFNNKLNLKITWFGNAERRALRYRKLGLYCFSDKLIKIHRLLDQAHFPPFFVSYVVYHEMLHSVYPPIKKKGGGYQIHHTDFKKKEREFVEYAQVKRWEEKNKQLFFHR